ncbi:MAG: tRNA pseudouridine(55) synthase TruB, partial [Zetaproteobacteria bacterium]
MTAGVLFLDKPVGWTSRKAVNVVVETLSEEGETLKAGHAGTLDPLASGMLPILLGEATRFADYGLSAAKIYRVCVDLSMQTDTLDKEGRLAASFAPREDLSSAEIEQVLQRFVGRIEQVPPAYSAVRIGG